MLACSFCWFAAALVYYGISLNATNISADKYLYVFLGGLTEIPSYFLMWPAVVHFGRRRTIASVFMTCAVCIFSAMAIMLASKEGLPGWLMFFSLLGRLGIATAYQGVLFFTPEIFPLKYRTTATGQCNVLSKIGSMVSPYINDLVGEITNWAPPALFGVVSVAAGVVIHLLPESNKKILQDVVPESNESQNCPTSLGDAESKSVGSKGNSTTSRNLEGSLPAA